MCAKGKIIFEVRHHPEHWNESLLNTVYLSIPLTYATCVCIYCSVSIPPIHTPHLCHNCSRCIQNNKSTCHCSRNHSGKVENLKKKSDCPTLSSDFTIAFVVCTYVHVGVCGMVLEQEDSGTALTSSTKDACNDQLSLAARSGQA